MPFQKELAHSLLKLCNQETQNKIFFNIYESDLREFLALTSHCKALIGNEGGVSYKSLDSLNKVLIAKLAALKASDKDTVIGNEWQKLTRNKDTLILSDGGGKVALLDEDPKNELQLLTRIKDTVSLSQNGGKFILNDDDPKNELQQLTIQNDTIFLSKGGGFVKLNKSTSGSTSSIPNGIFLDKSANLEITSIGPAIANGPWTVSAIYSAKSSWQTSSTADYLNEPHITSHDSFFFFDPAIGGGDCFTSYYFDTKQRYFAGPVDNVICASGQSKEKGNWDMKTLNSDNVGKCFFWFSTGTGLNIYYPSINKHYTSAAASISTTNLNWLANINTTNNKFFASYKKGNSIFISLNDINGDIVIYEYNFVTDQKKQLYNTKYNFTNNGLYPTRNGTLNDPRGNLMIDSFLVFPFDGKDGKGDLVNGKYIFGYFTFNFFTGKKDTIICNKNYPLLFSNAFDNKYLFMCQHIPSNNATNYYSASYELINIFTKKTITLNLEFSVPKINRSTELSASSFYFYNKKMYLLQGPTKSPISNIVTY
jgi:hypothetical protein